MATATLNLTGFEAEVGVLIDIARKLNEYRLANNKGEFIQTLEALGMELDEAERYWVAIVPNSRDTNGEWKHAKNNTRLAQILGIALEGHGLPRNWLVYRLLELHFRDVFLSARYTGTTHIGGAASRGNPPHRRLIHFDTVPLDVSGQPLAVHKIYQGTEPAKFTSEVLKAAVHLRKDLGEEVGVELAGFLFNQKMLLPPKSMAQLLAKVLVAGKAGEQITVVGAFCPDYAYEATGNPQIPYRYTFDGLGEGVGLVAQQFARIVPGFSAFLSSLGIRHRIILAIGDFEADSEAVLKRVGVNRPEFVRRCQASLDAFQASVPPGLPLTLELFAAARGGTRFREYANEATARMMQNDFGLMGAVYPDLKETIDRIPRQYGTFYRRWYGRDLGEEEVKAIVFGQGGEYSAMSRIYAEDYGENIIVLAGDRPEMHRFGALYRVLPVLCAKRAY